MKTIAYTLLALSICLSVTLMMTTGCSDRSSGSGASDSTSLVLNWKPEPEFGGFYAAQLNGDYKKQGLDVTITPGGSGTPGLDLVAVGHADFAIASADEVVIGRSRGMDVVAIYAVYQTCPQGIMTHASAGYDSLASLLADRPDHKLASVSVELGLPYVRFLKEKYGLDHVKLVPYAGGIQQFMSDPLFAQQCFVTSEPIAVKQQGGDPKVFLIAESGYNPYTTVVVTNGKTLREKPEKVKAFVRAIDAGWQAYMSDSTTADEKMHELNPTMDMATFKAAAEAQKALIQPEGDTTPIGHMTDARWQTLIDQMKTLGVIGDNAAIAPSACYKNVLESSPE